MAVRIKEERCQDIRHALRCEWLDTNGNGGYASSTILNCHTRKYHGLLVASLKSPAGRFVLLSKFDDSVAAEGKEFPLSCHNYSSIFLPHGHHFLREFRQDEYPLFVYGIGDVVLHKSLMMVQGANTVLIRYELKRGNLPLTLRLKPLLAFRGFHELAHENVFLQPQTSSKGPSCGFKITPYQGMPDLHFQCSAPCQFLAAPAWYRDFHYLVETERGFPAREDLFQPGIMEIPLTRGHPVLVAVSTEECRGSLGRIWTKEEARRRRDTQKRAARLPNRQPREVLAIRKQLLQAGREFLIETPDGRPAVIAGYHWFGDWGRDTLISLPGLTFCAGHPARGLALLESFTHHERNGLLPNFFGADSRSHAYNSADATLWFFWAVQQMIHYTGDRRTVQTALWPLMKRIIRRLMEGTDFDIFMNENGLLHAGNRITQLTWMDASVHGMPVTPRHGYAVEINALWYNAVCLVNQLASVFRETPLVGEALMDKIRRSFVDTFWIEKEGYLGDVFNEQGLDPAVRPNQILAVSLPYSPVTLEQAQGVVETVRRELLTPYGLRTLSPRHPDYRGRYSGSSDARDGAYHQGTVWPWLLGHFAEALLKVSPNPTETAKFLVETIKPLLQDHFSTSGLGQVSEVFDGDPPHHPNGCIAQAWSVAELIRLFTILDDKAKPIRTLGNTRKTGKHGRRRS